MNCSVISGGKHCSDEATHIVLTPYGTRRRVCGPHGEMFALADGFLVRPIKDVCDKCGAINVTRPIGYYCWCGSADKVERVNVDGLWYSVCGIHHPPSLYSLWRRWLSSLLSNFRRRNRNVDNIIELSMRKRKTVVADVRDDARKPPK